MSSVILLLLCMEYRTCINGSIWFIHMYIYTGILLEKTLVYVCINTDVWGGANIHTWNASYVLTNGFQTTS